jgi:hypothetical protein
MSFETSFSQCYEQRNVNARKGLTCRVQKLAMRDLVAFRLTDRTCEMERS